MNADELLDVRDDRLELQRLTRLNTELLECLEMLHRVFLQRHLSYDDMLEANLAWIAIRKAKGEL